ncbi:MAG: hypothetical protein RXR20_35730, partial [Paraburkholderia sp.]
MGASRQQGRTGVMSRGSSNVSGKCLCGAQWLCQSTVTGTDGEYPMGIEKPVLILAMSRQTTRYRILLC